MLGSTNSTLVLWQLIDSAFPTGGFAHSGGLEAASQYGLTGDYDRLRRVVLSSVQTVASQSLPAMIQVYKNTDSFWDGDHFVDVSLTNHVANKASRAQGEALLSSAIDCFGSRLLRDIKLEGRAKRRANNCKSKNEDGSPVSVYYHFAIVFAVVCKELEVNINDMCNAFLFVSLRGLTGSAVRLGLVGPIQSQRMQFQLTPKTSAMAAEYSDRPFCRSASTDPILDLVQSNHDSLFFKLFIS
eukprot:CFRG8363T1